MSLGNVLEVSIDVTSAEGKLKLEERAEEEQKVVVSPIVPYLVVLLQVSLAHFHSIRISSSAPKRW